MAELCCLATEFASAMAFSRSAGSSMLVSSLENMPETWLRPGRSDLSCTDTGTIATSVLSGSSSRSSRKRRKTPATNAITTSLTLTPKWFLTVLMSSRSSWANATLRCPVTLALNAVLGATNGAAMVSPLRARFTVSTTVETVDGTTLISFSGRVANLIAPLTAISRSDAVAHPVDRVGWRCIGFGGAQLRHQVGARDAVDARVVNLRHHGEPAAVVRVGARDVLDHPHLPQRATAVQRQRRDVAADLGELDAAARGGQADAVQVPVDVEVLVLHPHGVVEVQPVVGELLAELRHGLDAQRERVTQAVERVTAGHGRGVDLEDRAHVQRLRGGFEVEEAGVESAEPLHGADVRRDSSPGVRKSTSPGVQLRAPGVADW